MAGIDDNMTMMGEWLPSPSPRTFFSAMLGDDISSREPPSEDRGGELFLGSQQQMRSGNSDRKETGASSDQLNEVGPFSELRSSSRGGLVERMAARAGFNAPRLNTESMRSSDLSLNPDVRSPYLMISPGLSPTTLLESPVFVSNSLAHPSPTTGKFSFGNIPNANGRSSAFTSEALDKSRDNFFEDINTSSFAFKPFGESGSFPLGTTNKSATFTIPQQSFPHIEVSDWSENSLQSQSVEPTKVVSHNQNSLNLQTDFSRSSTEKENGRNTISADQRIFDTVGGSTEHSPPLDEQQDEEGDQRGSGDSMVVGGGGASFEDGYNWRKFGQKQVKGSEYPRSYYKCTHPDCQVKKKVERSHEGHITEIIYKGAHSHAKPLPNRRSAIGSNPLLDMQLDIAEQNGPQSGADGDPARANTQKVNAAVNPDWRQDIIEVTSSATVGLWKYVEEYIGNGRSSAFTSEALDKSRDNFFEDINTSSVAFKPFGESGFFPYGTTNKSATFTIPQQSFPRIEVSDRSENSLQSQSVEPTKVVSHNQNSLNLQTDFSRSSTEKENGSNTISADQRIFDTVCGITEYSRPFYEQQDEEGDQRGSGDSMVVGGGGALTEDGYNWRKYGQKLVKGSEYPHSYYKCTHPDCQVKKKVERSHKGHITEVIYKGAHSHAKPPPNRRSAIGYHPLLDMQLVIAEQNGPQSGADGDPVWANKAIGNFIPSCQTSDVETELFIGTPKMRFR